MQHQLQSTCKVLCQKYFIPVDFILKDKTKKNQRRQKEEEEEAYIHSGKQISVLQKLNVFTKWWVVFP